MTEMKKVLVATITVFDHSRGEFPVNVDLTVAKALYEIGYPILVTPLRKGRLNHTISILLSMIMKHREYDTLILPLFGTGNSIKWYRIISTAGRWMGKNIVAIVRGGSIVDQIGQSNNPFIPMLKKTDVIVTPSLFFQQVLSQYQFKCTVIENPIRISNYIYREKKMLRPRIIWMRAFHAIYNPMMAIDVAALLVKRFPDFLLVMAGADKGLLDACKKMVVEKGIDHCVSFPGYINLEQKNKLADEHDIYICTNKVDNAPFSFIEFMAMGLPIVSVATGGIPYLIKHEWNGLLCANDDPQQMANAIAGLIESPQLAEQIRINAQEYARCYDEYAVATKWKTVLDEIRNKI